MKDPGFGLFVLEKDPGFGLFVLENGKNGDKYGALVEAWMLLSPDERMSYRDRIFQMYRDGTIPRSKIVMKEP